MDKFKRASKEIHAADNLEENQIGKAGIHPLSRVVITFFYMLMVVSFSQYQIIGLAGMVLYLLIHGIWTGLSVRSMIQRIWPVFLLTAMVGIANPLLNREIYGVIGRVTITYGMISMITLMLKGIFCVIASYILVRTVGIRQISYVLRLLHVPKEIISVFMLMHRYLIVLLQEVERMQQAYCLRTPNQRGLNIRVWGSFVGLLLLRSIDRAEEVYESMKLRGYQGSLPYSGRNSSPGLSVLYVLMWGAFILMLRIIPVFRIAGALFMS